MSNEMQNVVKEVQELEKEVKWLAEEVRLHEYCRGHGLDFADSSDYAAAVAAVRKRDADGGEPGRVPGGESEGHMLHYGNSVAAPGISCYNEIELAEKLYSIDRELDLISEYNFFQDLGEKLKRSWRKAKEKAHDVWKATGSRRIVVNRTGARICVTGNTRDGRKLWMYLRGKGASSSPKIYDADGVVILTGQKFCMSSRGCENPFTSGVIKVKDSPAGVNRAEVCEVKGQKDTFYVNALGNEHHSRSWAGDHGWALP